jgi:tRNA pseudouridine38-40 synthase
MSHRMKLEIAYLGHAFHGWQKQPGQRTVQGDIERALSELFRGQEIPVVAAGRTDTGVHAAGQVIHLDPPGPIPTDALVAGLNARLCREIRVRSCRRVGDSFHARKSALGKLYSYRARWRAPKLPWRQPRAAAVQPIVDRHAFENALALLVGRHDWASFTVTDPASESTVRSLFRVGLHDRRDGFDLDFVGEGFLRYQVRRMVGALLEVGWEYRDLDEFRGLIEQPEPGAAIRTAPPHGLCLEHVYYRSCPAVSGGQPKRRR